jgi:hypothetical protein
MDFHYLDSMSCVPYVLEAGIFQEALGGGGGGGGGLGSLEFLRNNPQVGFLFYSFLYFL